MKYYFLNNYREIPQIKNLNDEEILDIQVVGSVLPFKVNNYVIDELINWDDVPNDPIFTLIFPRKGMLVPKHYKKMQKLISGGADHQAIKDCAEKIRKHLNPHPAGQLDINVPVLRKEKIHGLQHKYRETVLCFPNEGQTCHTYCTFCFRWPQFIGIKDLRFATREAEKMAGYLKMHDEVTDVLFTGGDPMVMRADKIETYLSSLLAEDLDHVTNIRIGTKALSYWPYRFLTDDDSEDILRLFERIIGKGKHLALMLHVNHYRELETEAAQKAISRIRNTGVVLRTQSPILKNINDSADIWAKMWTKQVNLGMIPYYMFIPRDTGAQHYFSIPLVRAWEIFQKAYQQISGLCRTARGPSMSCIPGKVQILGVCEVKGEKVIAMRMIQGRNPDWVHRPFFAKYDDKAVWINELKPAFDEPAFFFEKELELIFQGKLSDHDSNSFE
jgi:KamA family protein